MKEMARRARNTYWIRLPRPSPLGKEELAALLSNYLDLEDLTIEEQRHFFLVNCKSAHKQDVALTMDGWVTPGGVFHVCRTAYRMSWKKIFQWVADEIQLNMEISKYDAPEVKVHGVMSQTPPASPSPVEKKVPEKISDPPVFRPRTNSPRAYEPRSDQRSDRRWDGSKTPPRERKPYPPKYAKRRGGESQGDSRPQAPQGSERRGNETKERGRSQERERGALRRE